MTTACTWTCPVRHAVCSQVSVHALERLAHVVPQNRKHSFRISNLRYQKCPSRGSSVAVSKHDVETESAATADFLGGRGSHLTSQEDDGTSTSGDHSSTRLPYRFVVALATAGVLETAYLTWSKLTSTSVVCPASGSCETVLSSAYAEVLGIPLSFFGMLGYAAVAALAYFGASSAKEEEWQRYALLGGATVLSSTSAYLLYILATKFQGQACTWCLASASISFSIFIATLQALSPRELREGSLPGGALVTATVLALALVWRDADVSAVGNFEMPYQEPAVTSTSTADAVTLAQRLKAAGAQFYGAFWCSHCLEQKQIFGKAASAELPYVECYPKGYYQGVKLAPACEAAKLNGFPSWIINGNLIEGEQTLEALERALGQPAAALSP